MMIRRSGTTAALLAALFIAGCADTTTPVGGPATTAVSPFVSTVPVQPSAKPSAKPGAEGTTTLTGTVTAGVEPNCLVLDSVAGPHLLLIDDPAGKEIAKVGAKVTVVGKADPRMLTTCQQGTPFVVSQVLPG